METATSYGLSHLPLDDELFYNASFVDVKRRVAADFSQVTYSYSASVTFCHVERRNFTRNLLTIRLCRTQIFLQMFEMMQGV